MTTVNNLNSTFPKSDDAKEFKKFVEECVLGITKLVAKLKNLGINVHDYFLV